MACSVPLTAPAADSAPSAGLEGPSSSSPSPFNSPRPCRIHCCCHCRGAGSGGCGGGSAAVVIGRRAFLAPALWGAVAAAAAWALAASSSVQRVAAVQGSSCTAEEAFPNEENFAVATMDGLRCAQRALVDFLKAAGRIHTLRVEQAMAAVDRRYFVDRSLPMCMVYQDMPLPIGYEETISAPHMHATCLDLLDKFITPGARILDVGSGSGYLTACLGLMSGEGGTVLGIEKHPELAEQSIINIRESNPELLEGENPRVKILAGNVLSDVLENYDPFDAIHVGAAADSLPKILVKKLKPGGRLVIPVGPRHMFQELLCVDKSVDGQVQMESLMQVRYVPLTHPSEDNKPVAVD